MYEHYESTDTGIKLSLPELCRDSVVGSKSRGRPMVQHSFTFTHVFDNTVKQAEVFEEVADGIVQGEDIMKVLSN